MAKVLYIKANAKSASESRTFKMSDAFIEEYKASNPDDEITTLDLYDEEIGFLPRDLSSLRVSSEEEGRVHPVLKYAYQFRDADKIVIAAPFWNLSFPAILKAYLDYVTVSGITFKYTEQGPVGLVNSDKLVYFVSRGGDYCEAPFCDLEMGERYLRVLTNFLGVKTFQTISADGLDVIGNDAAAILAEATKKGLSLAKNF